MSYINHHQIWTIYSTLICVKCPQLLSAASLSRTKYINWTRFSWSYGKFYSQFSWYVDETVRFFWSLLITRGKESSRFNTTWVVFALWQDEKNIMNSTRKKKKNIHIYIKIRAKDPSQSSNEVLCKIEYLRKWKIWLWM